ncbi:GxxExxY protein [Patescibacteria group bacterium]|nr:GxxExxY protein [Patescibacteria group bacterium]
MMHRNRKLKREDLLYPELSYQIIGILFEVYNKLGPGYQERYYYQAIITAFEEINLPYQAQVKIKIIFKGKEINRFVDFMIDNKIILEIKKGERFFKNNIDQIYSYLKITNLKLGILANFTRQGIQFKRIVNIRN